MKKASIIFGSTTGNTENVAGMIAEKLQGYESSLVYVTDVTDATITEADLVLYGCSTWGYGELQDDFIPYCESKMTPALLKGKSVAVFGCGDLENYPDVFCAATDIIRKKAEAAGAVMACDNLRVDCEPEDNVPAIEAFAAALSV